MKSLKKEIKEFEAKKKIKNRRTTWTPNDILIYKNYAKLILRVKDQKISGVVLIDKSKISKLKKYKWRLKDGYAVSQCKGKTILIHRLLMNFPNKEIDHIDRNKLNNRRSNLRAVTSKQNMNNRTTVDKRVGKIVDMTSKRKILMH